MIHYHGLPITPDTAAVAAVAGGHAFVSWREQGQVGLVVEYAQSFAVDNGAFSAWRSGEPVEDWTCYYEFVGGLTGAPGFDWCVIPDVIDGSEAENDALVAACPMPRHQACPVWHMHESMERLARLVAEWPRVALGSSGAFASVGTRSWWDRMAEAMAVACDTGGRPLTKLHGLRMLDTSIFRLLPLSSADSTSIGRNVGIDAAWTGSYKPATKPARAMVMRQRIESVNGAAAWDRNCLKHVHADQGVLSW